MAIIKFDRQFDFSNRFVLHPSRSFSTGAGGSTGSVRLTQFKQGIRKDIELRNTEVGGTSAVVEDDPVHFYNEAINGGNSSDITLQFLSKISDIPTYPTDLKSFEVERFTPHLATVTLDDSSGAPIQLSIASTGSYRKNIVRKSMYERNAGTFRKCDWAYSNAHSVNFFTDPDTSVSTNPQQHAVIYPDPTGSDGSAFYRPDAGFTFEFYINPRYTTKNSSTAFDAGTILHYSSAYALSLVSGSSTDTQGRPDGFRLLLQLSSSAELPPNEVPLAAPPAGSPMIYSSSDNSLTKGKWHHVAVRWGGLDVLGSTGSFVIDGLVDSTFVIPSASITAPPGQTSYAGFNAGTDDANALFIGNFVRDANSSASGIKNFFNSNAASDEGLITWPNAGIGTTDPANTLKNKLNAEIHEVRIFKEHRDIEQIKKHMNAGFGQAQLETEKSGSLAFYLPPMFVVESRSKKSFVRPFNLQTSARPLFTPFNVTASFSSEMFSLNAPNFFRDFSNNRYPRFFNLTGSTSFTATDSQPSNQQILQDPQITARNFLIMPNDNGSFSPDYTLLLTGTFSQLPTTSSLLRRFVNDREVTDLSIISLNRMLGGKAPVKSGRLPNDNLREPEYVEEHQSFYNDQKFDSSSETAASRIETERIVAPPFNLNVRLRPNASRRNSPSSPSAGGFDQKTFYVFETTGDESSNQAVFFNIPNIFYGKRIKPGTLTLKDSGMTGSYGKVSMTLKDDGFGSLYRSDSQNPNKLHSVGNVFYEDGIVAVKSPHLFSFGSGSFEIGFEGTQEIFNREMYIEAPEGLVNSSSNATFEKLAPTDDANETANEFVYITQVLLHDKDLNVVGRATVSQPIKKRPTDSITFKLKKDY
ncbi:MAG: hypothetical protein CMA72_09415 [Euryarchaeota archaeon]|nr:hypothetical protein [Euryarchaeota archaeon]